MNSNEDLFRRGSFADKMRSGWTKEQLMEYYGLDENHYERIISCLEKIHGKEV